MSTMTNLLVKDDAGTPKEYTFIPVTDTPFPKWRSNEAATALEGQIRFEMRDELQKNGSHKLTAKLEVPIMETLGASGTSAGYVAPQKVAYNIPVIVTMFADKRSTAEGRAHAFKMMLAIMAGATSTTATGTLGGDSAGGAVLASVAPMPYLFTNIIIPN